MSGKDEKKEKLIESFAEDILNSLPDGVFTVDLEWKIRFFNSAAEQITGVPRKEAIGQICRDVFRSNLCDANCALKQSIAQGQAVTRKPVYIINSSGERIPISITAAPLYKKDGTVVGGVESFKDMTTEETLKKEIAARYSFHDMVGKSPIMQQIFKMLPDVALSDSNVLITGKTGTGKELLARAIHNLSNRKEKPFIALNCGAVPGELMESELFGYRKGAFTGAVSDKPGRFQLANSGTLFLDEIGELPLPLQVKLLRVIEDGLIEPLGAVKAERVDVRLIAATNRDLKKMVLTGTFREDLFYRLNVIRITLPELKSRREDIPILVEHFIKKFNVLKRKRIKSVSKEAMKVLLQYEFPGNVRELENAIEYAFVLCHGDVIELGHLPPEMQLKEKQEQPASGNGLKLNDAKREALIKALKITGGCIGEAAKILGVHRVTVQRWMKKWGIKSEYKEKDA